MERRTILLADDLLEQSISKIASSPWIGSQFDESVDIMNRAQLICFVIAHQSLTKSDQEERIPECLQKSVHKWMLPTLASSSTVKYAGFLLELLWVAYLPFEKVCFLSFLKTPLQKQRSFVTIYGERNLGSCATFLPKSIDWTYPCKASGKISFQHKTKLSPSLKKVGAWIARIEQKDISDFDSLTEAIKESQDENIDSKVIPVICEHLRQLAANFQHYFPSCEALDNAKNWIVNPIEIDFLFHFIILVSLQSMAILTTPLCLVMLRYAGS